MAIVSYNKFLAGGLIPSIAAIAAGAALLGIGLSGGHLWQVITGGSLAGLGSAGVITTLVLANMPKDHGEATDVLNRLYTSPREEIMEDNGEAVWVKTSFSAGNLQRLFYSKAEGESEKIAGATRVIIFGGRQQEL